MHEPHQHANDTLLSHNDILISSIHWVHEHTNSSLYLDTLKSLLKTWVSSNLIAVYNFFVCVAIVHDWQHAIWHLILCSRVLNIKNDVNTQMELVYIACNHHTCHCWFFLTKKYCNKPCIIQCNLTLHFFPTPIKYKSRETRKQINCLLNWQQRFTNGLKHLHIWYYIRKTYIV